MPNFLPPTPDTSSNLLGRLLVDPNTASELAWALIGEVDPHSTIDNKSLLQEFCEKRSHRGRGSVRATLKFHENPLPVSSDQAWPDPTIQDKHGNQEWPAAEMWVAAHLICNGPDPFTWKDDKGRDVLDHVFSWRNPLLFDQLMRMPNAPSIRGLEKRKSNQDTHGWLHTVAGEPDCEMMAVLISYGWNVKLLGPKRQTALHRAVDGKQADLLLNAGADPLAVDGSGLSVREAWVKAHPSSSSRYPFPIGNVQEKFRVLDQACVGKDRNIVLGQVAPALFDATAKSSYIGFAQDASNAYGVSLGDWRKKDEHGKWSLPGYLAVQSLRKVKSNNVSCMLKILSEADPTGRAHTSIGDTPDTGLAWLACRHYGEHLTDTYRPILRLLDTLDPQNAARDRAWVNVWRGAIKVNNKSAIATIGKKVDRAIEIAWNREINLLMQTVNVFLDQPKSTDFPGLIEALLSSPDILIPMASMPFTESTAYSYFCKALEEMSKAHPEHIDILIQAGAALATHPYHQNEWQQKQIKHLFKELTKVSINWDTQWDGEEERWNCLIALSKQDPQWGEMISPIHAARIALETPRANNDTRGPRL